MSGGSYNYASTTSGLDDLIEKETDLRQLADRLAGLGYAADAARETEELLVMLRQWRIRAQTRIERLQPVWHAIEWWDSFDHGEDKVHAALAEYRGDEAPMGDEQRRPADRNVERQQEQAPRDRQQVRAPHDRQIRSPEANR